MEKAVGYGNAPLFRSAFMAANIPCLLGRFSLSYVREDRCLEYFLTENSSRTITSQALVFAHDTSSKSLFVSRFYPELFRFPESRYLSAACFYLLVHHAGQSFHLDASCRIRLDSRRDVFENFYSRLKDFQFIASNAPDPSNVKVTSAFRPDEVDTTMIAAVPAILMETLFFYE